MRYLPNHKKIMLILTENCNLRCKYCYELGKQRSDMTFGTARDIVAGSLSDMSGYDTAVIELHGGEPFMNFDLIKRLDEWVKDNYSFPILFRATTNGTFVHGEVQKWLEERKDRYEIMLSLDGRQEDHDRNRITAANTGSFDMIDLDFFTETWEYCPVSMTVNEDTIENMAENTIWIQEKGFECLNAFQWATEWDVEKSYPILERELTKLVKYYSDNPQMHVCLLLNYDHQRFDQPVTNEYRYCVEIDDPIECYDANGKAAPCHGFTEFTVGDRKIAEQFAGMNITDFKLEPRNICYGCRLINLCRICFAANHMLTGDMHDQNVEICLFNQLCILKGTEIELNRSDRYPQRRLSEEDRARIERVRQYIIDKNMLR